MEDLIKCTVNTGAFGNMGGVMGGPVMALAVLLLWWARKGFDKTPVTRGRAFLTMLGELLLLNLFPLVFLLSGIAVGHAAIQLLRS